MMRWLSDALQRKIIIDQGITEILKEMATPEFHIIFCTVDHQSRRCFLRVSDDVTNPLFILMRPVKGKEANVIK